MFYIFLGGIQLYTERLIALSPPKMSFDRTKSCMPNYEGRAISFIIVVLKILLGLDGITEYQISRVAEKINRYVKRNEYLAYMVFYVLNLKIYKCNLL